MITINEIMLKLREEYRPVALNILRRLPLVPDDFKLIRGAKAGLYKEERIAEALTMRKTRSEVARVVISEIKALL